MSWITDTELSDRLVACFQRAGLSTDSIENWGLIVHDSNLAGQNEVVTKFANHGYTSAQAAAWYRAREFNIDLGLFWCLVKGGVTQAYATELLKELDRRKELEELVLTIDDEDPKSVVSRVRVGDLRRKDDRMSRTMRW